MHQIQDQVRLQKPAPGSPPQAIVLAAGRGTRMGGDLPKVVHPIADQPMIRWIVRACRDAGVIRCVVVIGYQGEKVRQALADQPHCVFVEQHEQLGTGHATQMAQHLFAQADAADCFVLPGDAPLIQATTLQALLATHRQTAAAATLATAVLDDPHGYGRIIRHPDGSFQTIVEQKDTTALQQQVREINTGYYCFRTDHLFDSIDKVRNHNAQDEYYLTDVPALLRQAGHTVALLDTVAPEEMMGINNPDQLEVVDRILRARLAQTPATDDQGRPQV